MSRCLLPTLLMGGCLVPAGRYHRLAESDERMQAALSIDLAALADHAGRVERVHHGLDRDWTFCAWTDRSARANEVARISEDGELR